jgi:creatinine amidohydrolase
VTEPRKPLLEDMTWPEARVAAGAKRVVLLPVGAIEQHGPHLPVDVDNRIVTWLCDEAARRRPDLLMSVPPIHYGFNEHNMGFPGTVSVEVRNFLGYVGDVVRSFVRQGHTRVILVNGHGSNSMLCALVAREVVNGSDDALVAALDHWSLAAELGAQIRESPRGGIAHACEYETSWYLHLRPDGVDMDKAVADVLAARSKYVWVDTIAGDGPIALIDDWSRVSNGSGVEGDPRTATAEKGERFAEEELRVLTEFAEEFLAMAVPARRDYTARGTAENAWYARPREEEQA